MMPRILVIDDDAAIAELVAVNLEMAGYEVTQAEDGIKGQALAIQLLPDLIMLDLMLPRVDGFTVCQRLRRDERTADIPVLMLTALSQTQDKVEGFNSGADDYLTKPFELEEMLARVRALLRRTDRIPQAAKHSEILNYGPLTLVPERFEAVWYVQTVKLTHLEFELLHCLPPTPRSDSLSQRNSQRSLGLRPRRRHRNYSRTHQTPENKNGTRSPPSSVHQNRIRGRLLPGVAQQRASSRGNQILCLS